MPPPKAKQVKGNAAKREQIADKVKEIQQRQKNWLRQRKEHLNTSSEPDSRDVGVHKEHGYLTETKNTNGKDSVEHTSNGADILRVDHDHHDSSSQHLANHVSDKLNVKVKHGFGAWLQSRQPPDNHDTAQGDYASEPQTDSIHFREEEKPFPSSSGGAVPSFMPSSSGVSSQRNSSRSYPLSPEEFDSLADSIASRVKKDLGIKRSNNARGPRGGGGESVDTNHRGKNEESDDRRAAVDGNYGRAKTFVQSSVPGEGSQGGGIGGGGGGEDCTPVDVSSHRCPFCSSLMATSAHAPMMLVPCGHTVCKLCSASHSSCRLCGTRVASLTTNIMLHQIIQEFHHGKGQKVATADKSSLSHDAVAQRTGNREEKATLSYSSQLRSLRQKHAVLLEEARSCREERDALGSRVRRAEKQLGAIEKEETSLTQKIQQLQEQLEGLMRHKGEYAGEYAQMKERLTSASEKATLVERTLKSLEDEIDKVQFLAEGQEDTYLQRQAQHR